MQKTIRPTLVFLFILFIFTSCEEDFDIITEYQDQTVLYAFLEHKDPWIDENGIPDTNWVVVNKAFLGDAKLSDMVNVADSVNYPDYNALSVTLQRIKTINPKSAEIGEPIVLEYTTHYKDSGAFARDKNIVFYTTEALMTPKDVSKPIEQDLYESFYYKILVTKPGSKEEVYATTKMIRGITEDYPLSNEPDNRYLQLSSYNPNHVLYIKFSSNTDARIYQLKIRTYYYEKKTDGNIYLDYVDFVKPLSVIPEKYPEKAVRMRIGVTPAAYMSSFVTHLHDTTGVEWRIPKNIAKTGLKELHEIYITLGSQETYVYNQITMPSDGIVQEKPVYTNIINGLGLFTSKWTYKQDHFKLDNGIIDSLFMSKITKDLKFETRLFTEQINGSIHRDDIIKRYKE